MNLKFNAWSKERIKQGRKKCTSRTKPYTEDKRVDVIVNFPLKFVKKYLWQLEGADNPEEFEKVWRSIFRGKFEPERIVWVHFGDFHED